MQKSVLLLAILVSVIITGCYVINPEIDPTPTPPPSPTFPCTISWAKTYGGNYAEHHSRILETKNGDFLVSGYTSTFRIGDLGYDVLILKLNTSGEIIKQQAYGGAGYDRCFDIKETTDNGFIFAGSSDSFGNAGNLDCWLLKLHSNNVIDWEKTYGGSLDDMAAKVLTTSDSCFIVAGTTNSFGAGNGDILIMKIDVDGVVDWQNAFGGNQSDYFSSIQETSDNGFIIGGYTSSFGGNVQDSLIIKLTGDGNLDWARVFGSTNGTENILSVQEIPDNGFIAAGAFDFLGEKGLDVWIIKMDSNGVIEWQKTFGGNGEDYGRWISLTSDGGFIVTGITASFGSGDTDIWVLKFDRNYNCEWQKLYGGTDNDTGYVIRETTEGCYILSGSTYSYGPGSDDYWILKLDHNGNCPPISSDTSVDSYIPTVSSVDITSSLTQTMILEADMQITETECIVTENPGVIVQQQAPVISPPDEDSRYP